MLGLGGTQFSLSGGNDAVALGTGAAAALLSGTGYAVSATAAAIATGANVGLTVGGDYNTIALGTGNALALSSGTGSSITGSQDAIVLGADNQNVTIVGAGDVISGQGKGDGLTLSGANNSATLSGGTIVLTNGAVVAVTGNDTVSAAPGASAEYIRNNPDGTSTLVLLKPAGEPAVQQETLTTSAPDGTGNLLKVVEDFQAGGSSVTTYSGTSVVTTDFAGLDGVGPSLQSATFDGGGWLTLTDISQPIYQYNTEIGFTYGNTFVSTQQTAIGNTTPNYFGTDSSSLFTDLLFNSLTTTPTMTSSYDPNTGALQTNSIYTTDNLNLFEATSTSILNPDFGNSFVTLPLDTTAPLPFIFLDDPLVVNLSGGAVSTTSMAQSGVVFDMRGNGNREATGWIAPGEAFLVVDPSQAGVVTSSAQMFRSIAALGAYDTDKSGKINAADAGYSSLRVWTPGAGGSQGALQTLAQAGIAEIDLHSTAQNKMDQGNAIVSTFDFLFANGTAGHGADVNFATGPDLIRSFVVMPGQGQQSFTNTSGLSVPAGQVRFGGGIAPNNLWLKQVGADLEIDLIGTRNSTTLTGWFGSNPGAKMAEIKAGNRLEIDGQVGALVSAMSTYGAAHPTFDPTRASGMPADMGLAAAIGSAWHPY